jgi:hypothetical protein
LAIKIEEDIQANSLRRFALLNAIRLSVFRRQLRLRMALADLQTIQSDIRAGVLKLTTCD